MSVETYSVLPALTREQTADILSQQELHLTVNPDITTFNPQNFVEFTFKPLNKEQDDVHALIRGEITAPPNYLGKLATLTAFWLNSDDYKTILDIAT